MISRQRKNKQNISKWRVKSITAIMFIFAGALVFRLADIQIFSSADFKSEALKQQARTRVVPASRGRIFYSDRFLNNLYPVAVNRVYNHLFAVPRDIKDVEKVFNAIWPLLEPTGITEETLRLRLGKSNDMYKPLASKLTDNDLAPFKELSLEGIQWRPENWRFYPEGDVVSHVVGFVGFSGDERVGQYGVEGAFDKELRGVDGFIQGDVDVSGKIIKSSQSTVKDPEVGIDLVLTIDRNIQSFVCGKLKERALEVQAESGQIVIVEPNTGAIMALCSFPFFDPNNYSSVSDISVYINPVISLAYEPGSVFKPITLVAAIDAEKITPETTYFDEGYMEIDTHQIKNFDGIGRGEVNMIKVLEDSLNTGAMYAQKLLGNNEFKEYVEKFGFGKITGIEVGPEAGGNIQQLYKKSDIFFATPSFGQGITTTPLQIVMSFGAIANGGKLMRPYLIKEKRSGNDIIFKTEPKVVGNPISLRAATIMSGMLVSVVSEGYDRHGGVLGYHVAGKTGTAQVAEGGIYGKNTIHSYAGFAPVDNPVFVALVKLDYPKVGRFASTTAAPLFGDIAKFILHYYEIPPDEK